MFQGMEITFSSNLLRYHFYLTEFHIVATLHLNLFALAIKLTYENSIRDWIHLFVVTLSVFLLYDLFCMRWLKFFNHSLNNEEQFIFLLEVSTDQNTKWQLALL